MKTGATKILREAAITSEMSVMGPLGVAGVSRLPKYFEYSIQKFSPRQLMIKRVFDFVGAIFALALFAIPMMVIAAIIKFESRGPVFYRQERVGLNGRKFWMLKFRSMRADAEERSGAVWAIPNDPRRTRLGTFLRSSSLDELPQLINVLKGEMSLVGPRPERPVFVEKFKVTIPGYDLRHVAPAGITGWAQVHGWRGNTSLEKRLEYDLYYISQWSLGMDVTSLFLTVFRGFINRNAY